MFAAHHKIDNLIAITDWNGQQIDGQVESVMGLGDLKAKWEAFGWSVIVADGHDMAEILNTYKEAHKLAGNGKPVMILFRTDMGHGVDFMSGTHKWHGKAPSAEQAEQALAQLKETLGDFKM
jgi:transketolase